MNQETSQQEAKEAFGTKEWAAVNINFQQGCQHNCRYCYAKSIAVRFYRATPESWCQPSLRAEAITKSYRKRKGNIMLPTTHDITPSNLKETLIVLRKLLQVGNEVLIVSKPHLDCIKSLCAELQEFNKQILFRFSIGSANNETLRYWEPGAPALEERLASLKWAFEQGYATSVSAEPMLDLRINEVIKATKPFVTDAIWLGRVNQLRLHIGRNCPGDAEAMRKAGQLLASQPDGYLRLLYAMFKNDPQIKFKDSIKKVVGLERPTEAGLDV